MGSLLPYLPVYYHSLGLEGSNIGLLGAVNPATTFLVAPLWGMLADRTNRHKDILLLTFLTSLVARLCISLRNDVTWLVGAVFVTALVNAPVKSLLDSSVMNQLNNEGNQGSYGKLRLWGQLGFGLGSSGVGFLLHRSKLGYKVAFILHALTSIPALIMITSFQHTECKHKHTHNQRKKKNKDGADDNDNNTNKASSPKIKEGLSILFHNADAMLFFMLVLVVGISSGVIENFAYVRMREVGGTGREMGISRMVSSASGVPMFWFSDKLIGQKSDDNNKNSNNTATRVLILALLSYAARFFIYATMKSPLGGLPAESLRGATFGAFWSTATVYAHRISPPGMSATMLTFLNAMYGGLGQSMGAIIGGKLQSRYGTVTTFKLGCAADIAFVCVYLLCTSLSRYSRSRSRSRGARNANAIILQGNNTNGGSVVS